MLIEAGGPGRALSVILSVMLPLEAVTVMVFATVGSVYVTLTCPFEPVVAGLGTIVPLEPSVKAIEAFGTAFPTASLAFTTRGKGKVVPTVPDCFPPDTVESEATGPTTPVSVKVAGA